MRRGKSIPGAPETDAGAVVRPVPATKRCALVPRIVVPVTAPQRSEGSARRALRIGRVTRRIMVRIPISHPLPYIAEHVAQPPGVRLLAAYLMRRSSAVTVVPSDGIPLAVAARGAARARRVLPLRFRREPHSRRQAVTSRVFPSDVLDGTLRLLEKARVLANHLLVGFLRHFGLSHPKAFGNRIGFLDHLVEFQTAQGLGHCRSVVQRVLERTLGVGLVADDRRELLLYADWRQAEVSRWGCAARKAGRPRPIAKLSTPFTPM